MFPYGNGHEKPWIMVLHINAEAIKMYECIYRCNTKRDNILWMIHNWLAVLTAANMKH